MEKTIQAIGHKQEIMEIIDHRVNQRVAQMKAELSEELAHFKQMQSASYNSNDNFNKQSQYLQLLLEVSRTDHKVHAEIDEAVKKLKELTYT